MIHHSFLKTHCRVLGCHPHWKQVLLGKSEGSPKMLYGAACYKVHSPLLLWQFGCALLAARASLSPMTLNPSQTALPSGQWPRILNPSQTCLHVSFYNYPLAPLSHTYTYYIGCNLLVIQIYVKAIVVHKLFIWCRREYSNKGTIKCKRKSQHLNFHILLTLVIIFVK